MSSSSSELPLPVTSTSGSGLPSVTEILNMSCNATLEWCQKLDVSKAGSKKTRQVVLIEHINAIGGSQPKVQVKSEAIEEKQAVSSDESTTFVWKFATHELTKCDMIKAGEFERIQSKPFVDKFGFKWRLSFYPKGSAATMAATKTAVYLDPVDFDTGNIASVRAEFTLSHVETGCDIRCGEEPHVFRKGDEDEGVGLSDFVDIPKVTASNCSICANTVTLKMFAFCGHSFCTKCTARILMTATNCGRIKCPHCLRFVMSSRALVTTRYLTQESFTLKATVRTLRVDKDMHASATVADVLRVSQSMEAKLDKKLSEMSRQINRRLDAIASSVQRSKRSFSEMSSE